MLDLSTFDLAALLPFILIGFAAQRLMELEACEVNRCCVRRGG